MGFFIGGPLGPYFELFQKSYARIAFYIIFVIITQEMEEKEKLALGISIGAGLGSWIHKENPTKDKKE